MKTSHFFGSFLCLLLVTLTAACAPIKTIEVWKEEAYNQPLQKVMVIAIAQQDKIRNQFENVLSDRLEKRGVVAVPSNKIFPSSETKPDRETVLAKVRELGIGNVMVIRSISKKEITNHQYGGVTLGGVAVYSDGGWYGYSYGYGYDRQFDTDFFTISTKLYDVSNEKPVWSYLSQVKVEGSREGAVNVFVPEIVNQLEIGKFVNKAIKP